MKRVLEEVKCPKCGSGNTVEVVYGYPSMNPYRLRDKESRTVWGGGCEQHEWDPAHHCRTCGEYFGQTRTRPSSLEEWKAYAREQLRRNVTGI